MLTVSGLKEAFRGTWAPGNKFSCRFAGTGGVHRWCPPLFQSRLLCGLTGLMARKKGDFSLAASSIQESDLFAIRSVAYTPGCDFGWSRLCWIVVFVY